jgi:hypothetical protein
LWCGGEASGYEERKKVIKNPDERIRALLKSIYE